MSLHVFANIVTPYGTASNNRGEVEGNASTLQKLIWMGEAHSTVSAEAIRFALRRLLKEQGETVNRSWDDNENRNVWASRFDPATYTDDDLLGYMTTTEASGEGQETVEGSATVRRSPLEVTRAVSLTPWPGDMTFNAASPGAQASAARGADQESRARNPVPYAVEMHATRYQFGLALTPERLRDKARAATAIRTIASLRSVAGNHSRFLFDFSPETIVLRITDDPAPRLLYCFETEDAGRTVTAPRLLKRIELKDISSDELIVGVCDDTTPLAAALKGKGIAPLGVKSAIDKACALIDKKVKSKKG